MVRAIDINRTPVSKTRALSSYQLTHDIVMPAWTSDIHTTARQEPTGGPVFILYSTQSSSYSASWENLEENTGLNLVDFIFV